jgi:hypothetical protein
VDVDLGVEERGEEREPENVVHMEMGEEHVDTIQPVRVLSQAPDPGAGVEEQQPAAAGGDLDRRGVASVSGRLRPGAGDGAAGPA